MAEQATYLFSTRTSKALAEKIAAHYGQELGKINFQEFSDGEFEPVLDQTVRGGRVFLIGSTFPPADNLMELLLMIDAAKRASAKNITVVIPYYGLARQDRKDKPRAPIGAKLVANLLTAAGATRIMTMDLHADQIQGFFEIPVDHLYASTIFVPYIQSLGLDNLTIASPDMGGAKRAKNYASHLGAEVVIAYKERKRANVVDDMFLIGDVKDRNVILIDDMIDTAGTLCKASDILIKNGAKSVRAIATHGVLSGKAYDNIQNSSMVEVIVTDSIPVQAEKSPKIKVLSCAPLFAEVMKSVHTYQSISSKFII
ncbi:ribose-phosphate pyrophosphokinase [Bergeyella cardium]|uniref:ribose-phosphate diphosphokinase n=1 Tax=Bergeyella cardium TaxID=1585976 RepID=A0A6P1QVT6_9FLAO|nr:ribose-phosphate pyrophosphokinase [Bergeyella cardium]QHN64910.1 ribose-phosphate diphosphokinase [Bergeyella cardium]WHE34220.1 ribose-phosphate pyrophosphokinase [Bergeyella cardium]WHF60871.1 ribose-phosphate pyrophosphokinase [Bergeyella cardium]